MWKRLKGNALGYRIRRQHSIGPYFADFACVKERLVIEVDGKAHERSNGYDARRNQFMRAQGWRIRRYPVLALRDHLDEVVKDIAKWLDDPSLDGDHYWR